MILPKKLLTKRGFTAICSRWKWCTAIVFPTDKVSLAFRFTVTVTFINCTRCFNWTALSIIIYTITNFAWNIKHIKYRLKQTWVKICSRSTVSSLKLLSKIFLNPLVFSKSFNATKSPFCIGLKISFSVTKDHFLFKNEIKELKNKQLSTRYIKW